MRSLVAIFMALACGAALSEAKSRKEHTDFVCSAKGRFSDDSDPECKHYHLCSIGPHGKWTRTSYECPSGTIFDSLNGHCSYSAECIRDWDSSASSLGWDGLGEFACRKAGRFDDVTDHTCGRYHECTAWKDSFFASLGECPPNSFFDPKRGICSKTHKCARDLVCTKPGRFASPNGREKYILCSKDKNGHFKKTEYDCPTNTKFDLELNLCTYHSDESGASHDLENLIDEKINDLNQDCSIRGLSANVNDGTCRSYFSCDVTGNGQLYKNLNICPKNNVFNSNTNLCQKANSCIH